MSTEKRFALFLVLAIASWVGTNLLMSQLGLVPKPPAAKPVIAKAEPKRPETKTGPAESTPPADAPIAKSERPPVAEVPLVPAPELVLGSVTDRSPNAYHLEVQLSQRGAGVAAIRNSQFDAELLEGRPTNDPVVLVRRDPNAPPSFGLRIEPGAADTAEAGPMDLSSVIWEVLRDEEGRVVTPVTKGDQTGQRITFRTTVGDDAPLTVTRAYTLFPGQDSFELALRITSDAPDRTVSYELAGPHGVPIEGEWYTTTFRDVFVAGASDADSKVTTISAYDVVKHRDDPQRFTSLPLKFAGVENQYFAVFLEPQPIPATLEQSAIATTTPVVVREDPKSWQKSDVSVVLASKPIGVGPNRKVEHTYRVYAGPKVAESLAPYDAADLAAYRKGWSLWVVGDLGASFMAKHVIAPMLVKVHAATQWVAGLFGGTRGSYGIAIILLTMTVRLVLLPLGRKQARAAKKMQDLQPHIAALKEKYGDDKEALSRAQLQLFREHGANPAAGCWPALIQLPVLIGLWQALNNSVALRNSQFLWIDNLAAPDMLFRFPRFVTELPVIGGLITGWLGPYFNVLPLVVVGLMLVQTKLFSPPPTTPEAQQQQTIMKYMMVFMMFMFYKVPSGLGIYFITSSLWQICERLLLPKGPTAAAKPAPAEGGLGEDEALGHGAKNRPPAGPAKGGWLAKLQDRAQELLDEAEKQRTVRNAEERRERDRPRPRPSRHR